MNVLLSYPRSGNTWLRYCLEFLSGQPSQGLGNDMRERPMGETFNLGVDLNADYIVHKSHYAANLNKYSKAILILRDPMYCIPRHTGTRYFEPKYIQKYIRCIEIFDEFEGPKFIIYYEDLMTDKLFDILYELCEFLEIDNSKVEVLKSDFFINRNRCLMLYEQVRRPQNKHQVELIDPEIWVKYFRNHEYYDNYLKKFEYHMFKQKEY